MLRTDDAGRWTLDDGRWTMDDGHRTMDAGPSTPYYKLTGELKKAGRMNSGSSCVHFSLLLRHDTQINTVFFPGL